MSPGSIDSYETHAREYLRARDRSSIGAGVAADWARSLVPGTEVLELGCGGGMPVTRALLDAGLSVWAIDSSPTLIETFRSRFPEVPVDCANALESPFLDREYGAVIAVGLMFLLSADDQARLMQRVSKALRPGGRFLLSAPVEAGKWIDRIAGCECRSLGREGYEALFAERSLELKATCEDEGQNHYYEVRRRPLLARCLATATR
ncbi:MAG: class I SAM-dependent methyltransferase [Acidobacteriota bacterium]